MLRTDSRKITKGDTFLALKGVVTDGHDYIDQAITNGATTIIAEHGNYSQETIIVEDTRQYLANYLKDKYQKELSKIKMIGITGTNGKTTTSYLIYQILNQLNNKTAYIGTIGFYLNDQVKPLNNTTPDLMDLYELFDECVQNNVETIVMEVSSHSLEIGRILGLDFDIVAFTNLTQDHLDVHGNFDNYLHAKLKLFNMLKKDGMAIINIDDPYSPNFILDKNKNYTYGYHQGDLSIQEFTLKINSTTINFKDDNKDYSINIPIPGKYNIYNYLMALMIIKSLGYQLSDIINIKDINTPKGRFDIINYQSNVIIVDYAHTPDAVENILNSVNEYKEGKIYTIIGCGGDRDRTKRPIMGDIATSLSDYVIFTNDNPRCESETQIMNDIVSPLKKDNYQIIYDRKKAIEKGIDLLKENDILLILGKGHEDYQIIGKEKHHHDDKEYAKQYISEK